jgi:uncharacterized UPF0146 family protein
MTRSSTTADTISTHFGNIPLTPTPTESLFSLRHSRLALKGEVPAGPVRFSGYLESDFLNTVSGHSPYRWRQLWGAATIGKWQILGGKAWSLLRSNRSGTTSDTGMMNTDVIEPAYHVGLVGARTRQVRLTREIGEYQAVLAWETAGNVLAKVVREWKRQHVEAGVFAGKGGQLGVTASAVLRPDSRFRIVTQQYVSRRAAEQALAVVPAGVNGGSTLEGIEVQVMRNLELYSYAGLVYGARVSPTQNRTVGEVTGGVNQRILIPSLHCSVLMSLQYSHMTRAIWEGRAGEMDYLMYQVRYTFN